MLHNYKSNIDGKLFNPFMMIDSLDVRPRFQDSLYTQPEIQDSLYSSTRRINSQSTIPELIYSQVSHIPPISKLTLYTSRTGVLTVYTYNNSS